ncbi:hypothetical protein [Streptomyces sp. AN091965]|uniref:hypothetical protein n=1 Tax=Streptomyces sp. AN091965 TaxID=2927803 RepID=UPI001F603CBA|nr:hypothetical protein [Streptomyces sp. AN091965]MCI3928516.1 hypothetical protein [Streptomyces sp. AN091965]
MRHAAAPGASHAAIAAWCSGARAKDRSASGTGIFIVTIAGVPEGRTGVAGAIA